jgi:hypothetical protein
MADVPKPIEVGAEMRTLAPFFFDTTWTGTIAAGGIGPGTPEMTGRGSGRHHRIQDGRWIVGDYEQDQFTLEGTFILRWELHWVVGWDPAAAEYCATLADNYGHAAVMRGRVEGRRLTFETLGHAPIRSRLVWDLTDPGDPRWRNEVAIGDGEWSLVEEYRLQPIAASESGR